MRKNKGYNGYSITVNGQYLETIEGTLKLKEKENIIEFQLLRVGRENEIIKSRK